MVDDEQGHAAAVDDWIFAVTRRRATGDLVKALRLALAATWDRAHLTLSEVTLGAIFRRAIQNAISQHPVLRCLSLRVDESGVVVADAPAPDALKGDPKVLAAGVRFLLIELFTVLGALTGDVLTRDLHSTLASVGLERAVPPRIRPAHVAPLEGVSHTQGKVDG